jgi:hypothetical protein
MATAASRDFRDCDGVRWINGQVMNSFGTRNAPARWVTLALTLVLAAPTVLAAEFPFGQEMTLDARRLGGSKRLPSLEIDERGAARLELWCKGGLGQFSIAGDTVVFVPGTMESRDCPADKAQLDDDLVAALGEATNWKRQGDYVSFIGSRTLRFRLNTN